MSYRADEYNKLVGVKVLKLQNKFDQGDSAITFVTDKGNFTLTCDGDCCSHSWFEHMELPEFPFIISKVREVDGADIPDSPDDSYECIKTYGLQMTTDKGYVDIDMRNSSNGYYGGSFELDLGNLDV